MEQGDGNQQAPQGQQQPAQAPQGGQGGEQPQAQPGQGQQQKRPVQLSKTAAQLKQMMVRERALKEREAKLAEKEKTIQEAEQERQIAKSDPLSYLKKNGWTYDQITKHVVNGPGPDPTEELKQELQQLKSELMETKKMTAEEKREEALNEARQAVRTTIEEADGYELVKATESYDQVFNTIVNHYEETGEVLSEDQAAKQIEEQLSGVVDRLLQTESVKKRLSGGEGRPEAKKTGMGTLGNADAAQRPSGSSDLDKLSEEESLAQIAEMVRKGQLPTD